MKLLYLLLTTVFLSLLSVGTAVHAQSKMVKIKQEKTLPEAHEFIITWEGGSGYKALYYEVKAVLDAEPMVQQQIFLHNAQRISAIVKAPWTFVELKALFEAHGFGVMDKSQNGNGSAQHK
jgi:hypothetical protein